MQRETPAEKASLSVGRRIGYGLLGGSGYRRIGAAAVGTYPAFLLIAAATATALAVLLAVGTARALRDIGAAWSHVPDFTFQAGKLTLEPGARPPIRVRRGGAVIVLAPAAPAHSDLLGPASVGLALTDREMILRTGSSNAERVIPTTALGTAALTKATLGKLLHRLAGFGVWVGALATVVYSILRDFVRAAIVAWLGLTAVRMAGRDPGWPQAWRVGLAAWTLPLLAEVIRVAIPIPEWSLWLIAAVYAVSGCLQLGIPAGP